MVSSTLETVVTVPTAPENEAISDMSPSYDEVVKKLQNGNPS